jgi:hypothetical protein
MKKLALIFPLLVFAIYIKGQPCADFHKNYLVNKNTGCGVPDIRGFKLFGQSKSTMVESEKTNKYQVVLFGGYDYKIGLCTESGFTPIHFRIINSIDQTVLYDNLEDKYAEAVGFSNEKTKNLIFEITLLATKKKIRDAGDNRACLGIAIYWQKIPKTEL